MSKTKKIGKTLLFIGALATMMSSSIGGRALEPSRRLNVAHPGYLTKVQNTPSKIHPLLTHFTNHLVNKGITRSTSHVVSQLSSLSSPLVRINNSGEIQVYVHVKSTDETDLKNMESLGATIQTVLDDYDKIQVLIPFDKLGELENLDNVDAITPPSYAINRSGSEMTEGDAIMKADDVRSLLGYTGSGVKVGVISDGVAGIALSVVTGDIPSGADTSCHSLGTGTGVTCESFNSTSGLTAGAEGTAMLEIIYDMAPDANLYFANVETSVDMVSAINYLANTAGVDVIVDDLGFLTEPFFEDGDVADAAESAVSAGVVYVSAAGNDALQHVQETFNDSDNDTNNYHNFSGTGYNSFLVTIASGASLSLVLQWDDDWASATNDLDLYFNIYSDSSLSTLLGSDSSATTSTGTYPFEAITYTNSTGSDVYGTIFVSLYSGGSGSGSSVSCQLSRASSSITFELIPYGVSAVEYFDSSDSIYGHPAATNVIAVGAIAQDDSGNDTIETYSSQGPSTVDGVARNKPEIIGIDNVAVTGNGGFINPFPGTSAAAPHVAACIALMLEANSSLSVSDVRSLIASTATDLGDSGYDTIYGNGLMDCYDAVDQAATPIGGGDLIKRQPPQFFKLPNINFSFFYGFLLLMIPFLIALTTRWKKVGTIGFFLILILLVSSNGMARKDGVFEGDTLKPTNTSKVNPTVTKFIQSLSDRGITSSANTSNKKLSTYSTEFVHIDDQGRLQLVIEASSTNGSDLAQLTNLGVTIERILAEKKQIQIWVPFDKISQIDNLNFVEKINPPSYASTRPIPIQTEQEETTTAPQSTNDQKVEEKKPVAEKVEGVGETEPVALEEKPLELKPTPKIEVPDLPPVVNVEKDAGEKKASGCSLVN